MSQNSSGPLGWRGRTGRSAYVAWGLGLMAVKYNLDRLVAWKFFGIEWLWPTYLFPDAPSLALTTGRDRWLLWVLVALALPFIAAGVVLTARRLRDTGWPSWLVAVFFAPGLNLVFFLLLACAPGRAESDHAPADGAAWWQRLAVRFKLRNPVASAAAAVALTVLLAVPLTALATIFFKNYGWGVFVALPFCLGMFAALVHGAAEPRTWGACAGVALLSLAFCGIALVAVAIEGVICVLMATPLAAPVVLLGATAGYYLQIAQWGRSQAVARVYVSAWFALPLALGIETKISPAPALIGVTTSVEIAAPPSVVWRHVVTFSELPPPRELIFRSGIAYPVRASIHGRGVGAVRHCEFSTGPFVEPITEWDEPRRLAFDVIAQPHPMRELSPYRSLHPPHLDGFFRSRHGQFLLVELPGGRTRLEGTTWYEQRLWPAAYWKTWSDGLVHTIHRRVLDHIRAEAEHAARSP